MKEYVVSRMYKASAGMANAVLVTLGIGLLFETFGKFLGWDTLIAIGSVAKILLAPALGAGIAFQLGGNTLVLFSAMIASTIGGAALHLNVEGGMTLVPGQPISAVLAAIVATYVGKRITGRTKLDMMAIPLGAVFVGGLVGAGLAAVVTPLLITISAGITQSVQGSPILASMAISLVWSILLMSPASSAAIAIALKLDPVSSAAALIGCTVQFVGFTLMSARQNDAGGIIAQILVTPKVQFPNLVKNPRLVLPTFIAAIICAPIATLVFHFQASYELAGLGLNSMIAPLNILATQGASAFIIYLMIGVLLPAIITLVLYYVLKKIGWAKTGDLHMEVQ
ncbi:PTS sugar transporter subunit IIC [Paenibacillus sp. PsM32]|uniref:PTS transporter subunit IIC n=1 Tax=unclassified Paenibacillus TaxID=185978 RepID=UPI002365E312|nr:MULTISPECIES: PTS sugar transporter subunit IIC [unclassified Paenibacillus]MDN4618744.1 PTS sugar transporter subunit IIC [Paenibacillus sp. PsM32]WDF51163.1 PTS sugar transporter subunit IIC [Paenibacillus sp. KACC 21273]